MEYCGPFGCTTETSIDQEATAALRDAAPMGRFVGLDIYKDRGHLAFAEVGEAWSTATGIGDFFAKVYNLPFYKALAFTLTYTFVCTPLLIALGFAIAVAVNSLHRSLKGLMIFFSLLPMIVTPLIGSLILYLQFLPFVTDIDVVKDWLLGIEQKQIEPSVGNQIFREYVYERLDSAVPNDLKDRMDGYLANPNTRLAPQGR